MASRDNLTAEEMVIHSTNKPRSGDMFSVEFLGIPENVANILGKFIRSCDRLNVQYDSTKMRGRGGVIRSHKDQVNFDPVNMSFVEDEDGVVESFILSHIFRQNNRITDNLDRVDHPERQYKFDVKLDIHNTAGKVTSCVVYKNCFFVSMAMSTMAYNDDGDCEINCIIDYDDVDVLVVDRMENFGNTRN